MSSKLEYGNIRAAVRIIMHNKDPITPDAQPLQKLMLNHPTPPPDRLPALSQKTCPPTPGDQRQDSRAIPLIPRGPEGLRPQLVAELITCPEVGKQASYLNRGADKSAYSWYIPRPGPSHSLWWHFDGPKKKIGWPTPHCHQISLAVTCF